MLRTIPLLLALTFSTAPSAAAQDRPIRAGTWDLSVTYGGGLLEATLQVGYKGDTLTTSLKIGDHESPVKPGKQEGGKLTLDPTSPSMDVRYDLEFSGDDVKGTFRYNGEAGEVKGKRRATGR